MGDCRPKSENVALSKPNKTIFGTGDARHIRPLNPAADGWSRLNLACDHGQGLMFVERSAQTPKAAPDVNFYWSAACQVVSL